MNRDLDGIYIRVQEVDGSWESKCLSDCSEDQIRSVLGKWSQEQLVRTVVHLADSLYKIGEQFDIKAGEEDAS